MLLLLLTLVATLAAAAGIRLTSMPAISRKLVPFSGGLLIGICAFGIVPEVVEELEWYASLLWLLAGFLALWVIDRFVYPVCPSCSHSHDHDVCITRLHGFATPMIVAASAHSFLDGFGAAASYTAGPGTMLLFAIAMHKIPEGLAFGIILRSAVQSPWKALAWCAIAESAMFVGGGFESLLTGQMTAAWFGVLLAVIGGSFSYLGLHAIHGEFKRRGLVPAFMPALTGAAGAVALQQGLRVFLR